VGQRRLLLKLYFDLTEDQAARLDIHRYEVL
jgi:hypothetical protein